MTLEIKSGPIQERAIAAQGRRADDSRQGREAPFPGCREQGTGDASRGIDRSKGFFAPIVLAPIRCTAQGEEQVIAIYRENDGGTGRPLNTELSARLL